MGVSRVINPRFAPAVNRGPLYGHRKQTIGQRRGRAVIVAALLILTIEPKALPWSIPVRPLGAPDAGERDGWPLGAP